MERILRLMLSEFEEIPASLKDPVSDGFASTLRVNLASVYHHYYLDMHGCKPPDPDPAQFEPVRFLSATQDFRFLGSGLGVGTLGRRNRSSELGNAFCRMFLHDHLGITYFGRMEHVLDRSLAGPLNGFRVERTGAGDAPDYLCARNKRSIFLAEAKGRYTSISFRNKEFQGWRNQFQRVVVKDARGRERPVKGYIVATRWATEQGPATVKSTIYAEDPTTSGDLPLDLEESEPLGRLIISRHYSSIAEKLDQPVLASALSSGSLVPPELRISAVVWEFRIGPWEGRRFVGGYFSPQNEPLPVRKEGERIVFGSADPFRLGSARGTFFGLDEQIFRAVVRTARGGPDGEGAMPIFENTQPFYSGVSILRDGSVLAPIDWFGAIGIQEY